MSREVSEVVRYGFSKVFSIALLAALIVFLVGYNVSHNSDGHVDSVDDLVDSLLSDDDFIARLESALDGDGLAATGKVTSDVDTDGDGIPNHLDPDIDGDGIPNDQDDDIDGDGIPNDQDDDADGDGIKDSTQTENALGNLALHANVLSDTATSGNILIANGSSWESAVISGDATVASNGALTISANSIITSKIADGSITTAKILGDAVDGTKISLTSEALGDVMYFNGTDWVRLGIGTDGDLLKVNTAGTAPEWGSSPVADFLTGSVMWTPQTTISDTFGIPLNGQTVTNGVADYPGLAALISGGSLTGVATIAGPDLVMADWNQVGSAQGGYFLRGLGNRTAGQLDAYQTGLPSTSFTSTGTTNTAGNHSHDIEVHDAVGSGPQLGTSGGNQISTDQTNTTGDHSHTTSNTVNGGGDAETAPKSASGLWYVFAEKN